MYDYYYLSAQSFLVAIYSFEFLFSIYKHVKVSDDEKDRRVIKAYYITFYFATFARALSFVLLIFSKENFKSINGNILFLLCVLPGVLFLSNFSISYLIILKLLNGPQYDIEKPKKIVITANIVLYASISGLLLTDIIKFQNENDVIDQPSTIPQKTTQLIIGSVDIMASLLFFILLFIRYCEKVKTSNNQPLNDEDTIEFNNYRGNFVIFLGCIGCIIRAIMTYYTTFKEIKFWGLDLIYYTFLEFIPSFSILCISNKVAEKMSFRNICKTNAYIPFPIYQTQYV